MEEVVSEIQTQLTAVQAALEGNTQSGLFQLRSFNGLPNEDINEWLSRFETLAKFHNWSQAKRLNALPLSLGGPAKAWYDTMPPETVGDFRTLTQGLKERFGSQSLEFLFRQELFARKQGPSEPLSLYTEDVIRKCQRLGLSDKDLMNAFINGLCEDTKNHVILSQPKSFAEAENLARLREAVSKTSSSPFSGAQSVLHEQRLKELENNVNLLVSLAAQEKGQIQAPRPNFGSNSSGFPPNPPSNTASSALNLKEEIIAAINTGFQNIQHPLKGKNQYFHKGGAQAARGRNLRTTDGQPICNVCHRVGHVAKYCNERPQPSWVPANQSNAIYTPPQRRQQFGYHNRASYQGDQNLNGQRPSQWGN